MHVHQTNLFYTFKDFLRASMSLIRSTGSRIVVPLSSVYTLEQNISNLKYLPTRNIQLRIFSTPYWMLFHLKSRKGLAMN